MVEADRVRRTAAGDERLALDADRSQIARQPEHERFDSVVRGEDVRAEPDSRDLEVALLRPGERLLELCERRRLCERAGRTAGADRRQPRKWDTLLNLHPSSSSTSGPARSTSPAPTVRDEISGARPRGDDPRAILDPRCPAGTQPRSQSGDDESPVDPVDRLLPRAVDVRHAHGVGGGERRAELVGEMARPGVQMRLEENEHAAACSLSRRGDGCRNLRRMVRVVVDDGDAALLADDLEAATRAAEA